MPGVYALGVVFYAVAFAAVATCRFDPPQQPKATSSFRRTIAEGFAYARGQPTIMAVLIVTVVMNMFGFSYVSIAPLVGGKVLELSGTLIGALLSMEGLGAGLGAITLAAVLRPGRYHQLLFCGASLFLVAIFIFGISPYVGLSAPTLFLAGIGLALFSAMQSTLLLVSATPRMRSRVMGLLVLAIGSGPPGALLIGAVADWLGPSNAIALMATAGIVLLAGVILIWPRLLHLDPGVNVRGSPSS
jgi:predicted MFS family arabinose efflux permease